MNGRNNHSEIRWGQGAAGVGTVLAAVAGGLAAELFYKRDAESIENRRVIDVMRGDSEASGAQREADQLRQKANFVNAVSLCAATLGTVGLGNAIYRSFQLGR